MPLSLSTSKPPAGRADPLERTRVTPGIGASAGRGVRAAGVDLHVHRLRAAQPRGQVVGRVDRDDAALVDDDDALAGLRDLGQDVRAEDDGVVAGELLISSRVSMICFGSRPAVGSSRISTSGLWMSACARPTRCL